MPRPPTGGPGSNQYATRPARTGASPFDRRETHAAVTAPEPTATTLKVWGQTVHLSVDEEGRCVTTEADGVASAFSNRTWVDDGVEFAVRVLHPEPSSFATSLGAGPARAMQVTRLFSPSAFERKQAAKDLLFYAVSDPLPEEVWALMAGPASTPGIEEYLIEHPSCPPSVLSTVIQNSGSPTIEESVSPRLNVETVEELIAAEAFWLDWNQLLSDAPGDVATRFLDREYPRLVRIGAAGNRDMPEDTWRDVVNDYDDHVAARALAISHPLVAGWRNPPRRALSRLRSSDDEVVQVLVSRFDSRIQRQTDAPPPSGSRHP